MTAKVQFWYDDGLTGVLRGASLEALREFGANVLPPFLDAYTALFRARRARAQRPGRAAPPADA